MGEELTVSEIKNKACQLTEKIEELLLNFAKETKHEFHDLDVQYVYEIGSDNAVSCRLNKKVILECS